MNTNSAKKQEDIVKACYRDTPLLATCSCGIIYTFFAKNDIKCSFDFEPIREKFLHYFNGLFDPYSSYLQLMDHLDRSPSGVPPTGFPAIPLVRNKITAYPSSAPMHKLKNIPEALLELIETPEPALILYWKGWFEQRLPYGFVLLEKCLLNTTLFIELKTNTYEIKTG